MTSSDPRLQIGPIQDVAVESDEKLLAVATSGLMRFNANGSLDSSFGANNSGAVFPGLSDEGGGTWIASLNDGKMLTSGMDISREDSTGALDPTFGTHGNVEGTAAYQFITTADGKIVAASLIAIERIADGGTYDDSFGKGGVAYVPLAGAASGSGTPFVVADGDQYYWIGNVTLASQAGSREAIEVARFNSDGTIDTKFGNNGQTIIASAEPITNSFSAVLQADGKLMIVGRSGTITDTAPSASFQGNMFTARIDANGAP